MNMLQIEIALIASIAAIACALPGVFLVLRGMSLMSDAISHAILPGIALIFLAVHSLNSPLLLLGAAFSGLLTVVCTELLITSQKLKKDAAIGLVFPLFFSVGVILISQYARDVHLDTDMVLLGELAFASLNRMHLFGIDVGSYALWVMCGISMLNLVCIGLFFKELQMSAFDVVYATVAAGNPIVYYYLLMTLTSITAVGAFDVVGAIVVVALMVTPATTAFLCTQILSSMLFLSVFFGVCAAISGYVIAAWADVSIAGMIAFMSGVQFVIALFFAPSKGLIAHWFRQRKNAGLLEPIILCSYLNGLKNAPENSDQMAVSLGWSLPQINRAIRSAQKEGLVIKIHSELLLTQKGYKCARESTEKFCVFS